MAPMDNVNYIQNDTFADEDMNNYDYNYTDDDSDYLPLPEVIPTVTIYSLIGLLGLVGNLLVIFAITRVKRMRSITNLFLLSLASADLLLVCICVPVKAISFYTYSWRLGETMCKLVNYIQTVSMICSAFTLTVMSIERFIAIRYPLRARSMCTVRHARIVIISTWITSFLTALPVIFAIILSNGTFSAHATPVIHASNAQSQYYLFIYLALAYRRVGKIVIAHWCHKHWEGNKVFGRAFELYMMLIILVIPCSVMIVTYTWISNIIWHVASSRASMRSGSCSQGIGDDKSNNMSVQDNQMKSLMVPIVSPISAAHSTKVSKPYRDDDNTRKQVVMMLMVVVVLFAVCWIPILTNNLLVAFEHLDNLHMGYLKPLRMAFHLLSYANSCVNPFVYAFMSKHFREGFKHSINTCVNGERYLRRTLTSGRSLTTMRASTSNSCDQKMNGLRCDSIAMRRSSDIREYDNR